MTRRTLRLVLLVSLVMAIGVPRASADGPHFLYANATILTNTGSLQVSFKEVGLGLTAVEESVTLHVAVATATYQCFNGGGKSPNADNKQTVQTSLLIAQTFPASNGEATGRFVIGPVRPGTFDCPNGQSLFLVSVSYAFMRVVGSAGDSLPIRPDPVSMQLMIPVG
jgi:hypothetical protein